MTLTSLISRYVLFAIIATLANLIAQRMVLTLGKTDVFFFAAVAIGTMVGLTIKYLLDKRWVFCDTSTGLIAHSKKFGLYSLMGVITTLIFWCTETAFWFIWQTNLMREIGAIIGLGVGYTTKYRLDQKFVFADSKISN